MQNEIPLIDCPIDYIFGEASGKVLNEYMRFPCKIKCGVYAFMAKGTARATVNITQYNFKENDNPRYQYSFLQKIFLPNVSKIRNFMSFFK
jgi:hypothetical protein